MSEQEVRVIIPADYGCLDERRLTDGVAAGTQAEQVVAECNGGAIGGIDHRLVIDGETAITFLMKPIGEVEGTDEQVFGHDPALLEAVCAVRASRRSRRLRP